MTMDKIKELLEKIVSIGFSSDPNDYLQCPSIAREALTALHGAGESKVRYAGWSPDKGNHYIIESSPPADAGEPVADITTEHLLATALWDCENTARLQEHPEALAGCLNRARALIHHARVLGLTISPPAGGLDRE